MYMCSKAIVQSQFVLTFFTHSQVYPQWILQYNDSLYSVHLPNALSHQSFES